MTAMTHSPFSSHRLFFQPLVGMVAATLGLLALSLSVVETGLSLSASATALNLVLFALCLIAATYLGYRYPVHMRHGLKMDMSAVPLYLAAVVLMPVAAALVTAVAVLLAEVSVRGQRGTLPSDIATDVGRWTLMALAASYVAHTVPSGHTVQYTLVLIGTALVLLAGDIITVSAQLAAISGERYRHLLVECVRATGIPEAGQYALGLTGAVLAIDRVWYAVLLLLPIALFYQVSKRAKEMHDSTRLFLENMADQVDRKDPFTQEHSLRVMTWTKAILREFGVVGAEASLIITAARVHDIGKLSLPGTLLHKNGELAPEERLLLETHPALGADLLGSYPAFARGAAFVRGHHERFDGLGYPDKIAGTQIPFGARVIAVADSYDAMTSDRPYRAGMSRENAAAILSAGKGTQWDPQVVEAFLHVIAAELAALVPNPAPFEDLAVPKPSSLAS